MPLPIGITAGPCLAKPKAALRDAFLSSGPCPALFFFATCCDSASNDYRSKRPPGHARQSQQVRIHRRDRLAGPCPALLFFTRSAANEPRMLTYLRLRTLQGHAPRQAGFAHGARGAAVAGGGGPRRVTAVTVSELVTWRSHGDAFPGWLARRGCPRGCWTGDRLARSDMGGHHMSGLRRP